MHFYIKFTVWQDKLINEADKIEIDIDENLFPMWCKASDLYLLCEQFTSLDWYKSGGSIYDYPCTSHLYCTNSLVCKLNNTKEYGD